MPTCAAVFCQNRQIAGSGKSYHKFPFSQPNILKRWVANMRRDMWQPNKKSVLCSDHFQEASFDKTGQTRRLRSGAVPTIFNFPAHLQKPLRERNPPKERVPAEETPPEETLPENTIDAGLQSDVSFPLLEHNYWTSPRKLKRKLKRVSDENLVMKKRLKVSKEKVKRLKKKVHSMTEVLHALEKECLLSNSGFDMLKKTLTGAPLSIFSRMLSNEEKGRRTREAYPPALRSFAYTLQFYSSKAYDFVRKTFALALPSVSTIRLWYSKVSGDPGFTEDSFRTLKQHVKIAETKNEKVLCSLMLDEMCIRKHVEWDGKKFTGYVDIGAEIEDDDVPEAKQALVFMVVSLRSSWKLPVAYFLISSLSGEERANLVKECLIRLYNVGVVVPSLTCDGPSCHFSMAKCLGADFTGLEPKFWFPHPAEPTLKVYMILDICHMLKLVRNTWSSMKVLKDNDGKEIKWEYLVHLQELQEKEELHAANRLRKSHISWQNRKMKVDLAAQTISASVADAIEWCEKDLKLKQFEGSAATVKFIRTFDRLFDLLNSRNPCAKGYKAPMKTFNQRHWRPFLAKVFVYLKTLCDPHNVPMFDTKRKTGFIGFYISALSIQGIFDSYVSCPEPCLRYLLTYKFSQDHLELFFCAVRAKGGWNNNPTSRHFASAYKKLLVHHDVIGIGGNATPLDSTQILSVSSLDSSSQACDILDINTLRKYDLEHISPMRIDHDYGEAIDFERLSLFVENIVLYIAGFVTRKVENMVTCADCIEALKSTNTSNRCFGLLNRKNNGGLKLPSNDVFDVCECTERCIRKMMRANSGVLPKRKNIHLIISSRVLQEVCSKTQPVFSVLNDHVLECSVECNHVHRLVKLICECYLKIRFHYLAKKKTEQVVVQSSRKKLSKLILFRNE